MVPEAARTPSLPKRGQGTATAGADGKRKRRALWPEEVRNRGPKVFSCVLQLIHDDSRIRVEVRSKKGGRFYAMAHGRVVKGSNRSEAILRLIEVIQ